MSGDRLLRDDLGSEVALPAAPARVVSLVPSLTESIAVSAPALLVGATDWCSHPPGLAVPRVRGTKNPNRRAIADLKPDLVLANKEENRKTDVEALRAAGIPVWVTLIETVDEALASLRRLFAEALGLPVPDWLEAAARAWAPPPEPSGLSAAIAIWRDPWMVVGSRTFTGDLLSRLGIHNVFADDPDRYPSVSPEAICERSPDIIVLPDEPYRFTVDDGPEAFPGQRIALVAGRLLTWYGPSLATAREQLAQIMREARTYS